MIPYPKTMKENAMVDQKMNKAKSDTIQKLRSFNFIMVCGSNSILGAILSHISSRDLNATNRILKFGRNV